MAERKYWNYQQKITSDNSPGLKAEFMFSAEGWHSIVPLMFMTLRYSTVCASEFAILRCRIKGGDLTLIEKNNLEVRFPRVWLIWHHVAGLQKL